MPGLRQIRGRHNNEYQNVQPDALGGFGRLLSACHVEGNILPVLDQRFPRLSVKIGRRLDDASQSNALIRRHFLPKRGGELGRDTGRAVGAFDRFGEAGALHRLPNDWGACQPIVPSLDRDVDRDSDPVLARIVALGGGSGLFRLDVDSQFSRGRCPSTRSTGSGIFMSDHAPYVPSPPFSI